MEKNNVCQPNIMFDTALSEALQTVVNGLALIQDENKLTRHVCMTKMTFDPVLYVGTPSMQSGSFTDYSRWTGA